MKKTKIVIEKINFVLEEREDGINEKTGKMMYRSVYKKNPSTFFDVEISNKEISVNGYKMKLVYDGEFLYKLQKTQIKTMGRECLERFFKNNYADERKVDICEHIIKYGKCML